MTNLTATVRRQRTSVRRFHRPTVWISTAAMAVPQAADNWPMLLVCQISSVTTSAFLLEKDVRSQNIAYVAMLHSTVSSDMCPGKQYRHITYGC